MCAIIDANVVHEVFGQNKSPAGEGFFNWLDKRGRLMIGGDLTGELFQARNLREWAAEAQRRGTLISVDNDKVIARTNELKMQQKCGSDDPHIIALAQVSGARLLYSNDRKLRDDFKNSALINPPGKIYSTLRSKKFSTPHKELLRTNDCNNPV